MNKKDIAIISAFIVAALTIFWFKFKPSNVEVVEPQIIPKSKETTEVKKETRPVITKEIISKEKIKRMTLAEFKAFLGSALTNIPLKEDLASITSNQAHHIPKELLEGGKKLGVIREVLSNRPEFTKSASAFYEACAKQKKAMSSFRAMCLSNLIKLARKENKTFNLEGYNERVVELATEISDI